MQQQRRSPGAMARRAGRAACLAAAVFLVAAAGLVPGAHGDAFPCTSPGGAAGTSACGARFAALNGSGSFLPAPSCAACTPGAGACSCPPPDCLTVVSACREAGTNLMNYKIGFGGCKYYKSGMGYRDTRIEWVAFQGVDPTGKYHVNHAWLRDVSNGLRGTSKCANLDAGDKSNCCLQLNVQGNGQINLFKVGCGTRAVIWMGDSTFSSCNSAPVDRSNAGDGDGAGAEGAAAEAPAVPATLPLYLFAGAAASQSFCGAPSDHPSQVCGPYTLPLTDCTKITKC